MGSICSTSRKNKIITQNNLLEQQQLSKINFNETNSKINSQNPSNKRNQTLQFHQNPTEQNNIKKEIEDNYYHKGKHRKTVSEGNIIFKTEDKLESKNICNNNTSITNNSNENNINSNIINNYQRRKIRSLSLIQKKKMGSQIFKEELKLKVTINTLIEENNCAPTKKYKIISKLGDGSYGVVYLAVNIITKQNMAMKKIKKVKENEIDDMEIKNEINILKKLDHPNIVKIIEFYSAPKAYYIITDFCSCGELYNQIKNQYSENQLAVLFYQVLSGLYYLHSNNIVHRDLKLENILISEIEKDKVTNEKYFWVKIIDFGTAKIFEKNKS